MNKRVFKARNISEAMSKVKAALGSDAMIIATRKIPKNPRQPYSKDMIEVEAALGKPETKPVVNNNDIKSLKDELITIKDMLSIAGLGSGMHNIICNQSGSTGLLASLLRSGISEKKAYSMVHKACYSMERDQKQGFEVTSLKKYVIKECVRWIEARNNFKRDNNSGVPHVAAFAGPTGVGKTTTIAKLAAHLSLRKKKRVGLISIDNYRIGAFEQLKSYASIMGLYCMQAYSRDDLVCALDRMKTMDIVLVDTAGHSHYDKRRMDELSSVINGDYKINVHLVLSATTDFINMKEAVKAFSSLKPDSYVFTKIDETKMCGKILDQVSDFKLPVSLVTNGQKVPEDLIIPDKKRLLSIILGKEQEAQGDGPGRWT